MPEINLTAESRPETGSAPARRLRTEGKIPAVVYGHGIDPLAVSVGGREVRAALTTESGTNALINLSIGADSHLTLARVLQRDPVRNTVTHIDFQVVSRDELITADVGITLIGEPKAVHEGGGVVDQQIFTLTIEAIPANIPNSIEVDISELEIGGAVRIGDLNLPEGVSTAVDADEPIVTGALPALEVVEEPEVEEGEEGVEGVEGEAAEGAEESDGDGGADAPADSGG
ncbi:MAG: 50S ribosomal protein L25 [Acidimicrobiales bacterium]